MARNFAEVDASDWSDSKAYVTVSVKGLLRLKLGVFLLFLACRVLRCGLVITHDEGRGPSL